MSNLNAPGLEKYPPIGTEGDIRKLQEEMKQLRHQQFLLGTGALTVYGFVSWGISLKNSDAWLPTVLTIAVFVILGILYWWSLALGKLNTIISHYLRLRGASEWEEDFWTFCTPKTTPYSGQSKWFTSVYMCVGAMSVVQFFANDMASGGNYPLLARGVVILILLVFIFLLYLYGFHYARNKDTEVCAAWKPILEERKKRKEGNLWQTSGTPRP